MLGKYQKKNRKRSKNDKSWKPDFSPPGCPEHTPGHTIEFVCPRDNHKTWTRPGKVTDNSTTPHSTARRTERTMTGTPWNSSEILKTLKNHEQFKWISGRRASAPGHPGGREGGAESGSDFSSPCPRLVGVPSAYGLDGVTWGVLWTARWTEIRFSWFIIFWPFPVLFLSFFWYCPGIQNIHHKNTKLYVHTING